MSLLYPSRSFVVSEGDAFIDQYNCLLCHECVAKVQENQEKRKGLAHDARWPERRATDEEVVQLQQECDYCGQHIQSFDERVAKHKHKHYPSDHKCTSCEEELLVNTCKESKRECGHHCNCSWKQDHCCWCDMTFGE